ncbi:TonB-dependent receptor [Sphingosinicella sp.]|uniref:TonB-dependent receptor n=1 Tax=Sphingosinicella sp. TaxID=1917971 RepID=UPI00180B9E02|nr:TonB-dependent receptor [Sphingosinicella sp.]MBA4759618.1 TonB-dependent receptor [Sphingosinicella sp.]
MTVGYWKSAAAVGAAVISIAVSTPVRAQQRAFDVAAQDARKAIPEFARQAGIQISAPTGKLRGVKTRAIKGSFDTRAALRMLIDGTGLTIVSDDKALIVLGYRPKAGERRNNPALPAATEVETAAIEGVSTAENGDIIITATKRNERLRDTAIAISALSAETLSKRGAVRLEEYADRVPGLSVTNSAAGGAQSSVSIRGLTTGTSGNPTVAVYIDDAPFNSSTFYGLGTSIPDLDPGDLERIEVLRGPQGTLYGASSLGGLIRYVTRAPNFNTLSGRVELTGSAVEDGDAGLAVRGRLNVPLSDYAAVSASGLFRLDPGFIDDPIRRNRDRNETRYDGGRIALALKPAEMVSIDLSAMRQHIRGDGSATIDLDAVTGTPRYTDLNTARIPGTDTSRFTLEFYNAAVKLDFDAFEILSNTNYSERRFSSLVDYSEILGSAIEAISGVPGAGAGLVTDLDTEKFTQEFRATSLSQGFLGWQIGVFYTHEKSDTFQTVNTLEGATGGELSVPLPDLLTVLAPSKYEEIAGFGNLTLNFTSRFDVTAGLRYSHNKQSSRSAVSGLLAGGDSVTKASSSESQATFLINPRYRVTDDLMVYGRVASGFRPGGPNAGQTGTLVSYGTDKVLSYEAGFKADLAERLISLDLAGFLIDWTDIQTRGTDPVTGINYYYNANEARSQGFEASVVLRPMTGLSLIGNVAYTDAYVRKGTPSPSYSAAGDPLPDTPDWASYLAFDYEMPIDDRWMFSFGGGFRHVDRRLSGFQPTASTARFVLPAYDTFDFYARLESRDVELGLFLRNLTNKRAYTNSTTMGTVEQAAILQPRTFGLTLAKNF